MKRPSVAFMYKNEAEEGSSRAELCVSFLHSSCEIPSLTHCLSEGQTTQWIREWTVWAVTFHCSLALPPEIRGGRGILKGVDAQVCDEGREGGQQVLVAHEVDESSYADIRDGV